MDNTLSLQGQCLCGAVTITATHVDDKVGVCHCGMCRTWGGGPLHAVDCGTQVSFTGEDAIQVYDSSEWAERGFCSRCGTHLFYRLKQINQYQIPVGLLDYGEHTPDFTLQVYTDKKPDYYSFSNATQMMTEADVMALYGPKSNE